MPLPPMTLEQVDEQVALPGRIRVGLSERPNGCWSWAFSHSAGYACVWWKGQQRNLHRVLYELLRATPPQGMVLDHVVCGDRSCPNPWHVEPATNGENLHRERRERDTCIHGHPLDKVRPDGRRRCSTCAREEAFQRQRQKRGIPDDWPRGKHFHRRGGGDAPPDPTP